MNTEEYYRQKDSQQIAKQSMIISELRNRDKQQAETIKRLYKEIKQLKRELNEHRKTN